VLEDLVSGVRIDEFVLFQHVLEIAIDLRASLPVVFNRSPVATPADKEPRAFMAEVCPGRVIDDVPVVPQCKPQFGAGKN